ncbi:hypothetical protein KIN20_002903 [Parelaphostrongylus tenuis]|uniref:Uncharacterized protein n=1 Tax=Parelaphostrongylus tenuis TaxID=148309 RepID=A0AAD5QFN7_PARTN|nr:hypothetical protein KIN20_002903 [Parelaphostrongylus tenuis]
MPGQRWTTPKVGSSGARETSEMTWCRASLEERSISHCKSNLPHVVHHLIFKMNKTETTRSVVMQHYKIIKGASPALKSPALMPRKSEHDTFTDECIPICFQHTLKVNRQLVSFQVQVNHVYVFKGIMLIARA